jgi:hypothetical protein
MEMWANIFSFSRCVTTAEVGVYEGIYAEHIMRECDAIATYLMIDPWQHLPDWNKPANKSQHVFDDIYLEAIDRTFFAKERLKIIRKKTIDAAPDIEDNSLDAVYIDGDHTLRGITIDLTLMLPKVKSGGIIGGNDFTKTIWQHSRKYDPTFVFPYAVFFAEANNLPIYALPYNQFVISNDRDSGFSFIDLTGKYENLSMIRICTPSILLRIKALISASVKRVLKKII